MLQSSTDKLGHLSHGWNAWRVDVVDARTDFGVELLIDILQQLHAGACSLNRGDIGVETSNSVDDLTELGVAQVGVNLRGWRSIQRHQAEGAHGPVQVAWTVFFTQWQQLTQCWLINLNDFDAGFFQVLDLISQRHTDLVSGDRLVDIVTHKGPRQDGDWTSEHALDVLVR